MRVKRTMGALFAVLVATFVAGWAPAIAGVSLPERPPPVDTGGGVGVDGMPYAIAIRGPNTVLYELTTSGTGSAWTCSYFALTAVENPIPVIDETTKNTVPEDGQVVVLRCWDGTGAKVSETIVTFSPAEPFGSLFAAEQAAGLAREQLVLPEPDIQMSPPRDARHLVGLASWFYVDTPWVDRSESASLAGVTSTVTAVPVSMTWDPGDGSDPVVCGGPGMAWRPDTEPPCSYTYVYGGAYTVTATITWDANWVATNGQSGALGTITTTASWDIEVRQAQAVLRN